MVFVFGSNEKGIHGGGAARTAVARYGAVWGQGEGRQGNAYAIPTCSAPMRSDGDRLPLPKVREYVHRFVQYAKGHPEEKFKVTQVGCGLAGLAAADVAPMFEDAPRNCYFDLAWEGFRPHHLFWGTY
jgi:hypothetical protein